DSDLHRERGVAAGPGQPGDIGAVGCLQLDATVHRLLQHRRGDDRSEDGDHHWYWYGRLAWSPARIPYSTESHDDVVQAGLVPRQPHHQRRRRLSMDTDRRRLSLSAAK